MTDENDAPLTDTAGFSAVRLARIDTFFNVEVARGQVPGAVLLIERKGKTVLKRAWGYRSHAARTPMTLDTIFRIYSMTKPIVSVAAMMLAAEGKLHLGQEVGDFIPSFRNLQILLDGALVAPERAPTVHDLMRHTSGLIYGRGTGPVDNAYRRAGLFAEDPTNEEFADRLAMLPLAHQPGQVWDYSHATEVLGRVVEVVAGRSLGQVLRQRLIEPLGMRDTGFVLPEDAHDRLAEPLPGDTLSEAGTPMFDPRLPRAFEAGGMGLVSTLDDYARFARMLLAGGLAAKHVYLSRSSLRFMTSDHIGPCTGIGRLPGSMLQPGFGFGLGFAVRTETGAAPYPGSRGEFNWSGIAGTYFWIDPARDLFAILLTQSPRQRLRYRETIKTMVYDALVGGQCVEDGATAQVAKGTHKKTAASRDVAAEKKKRRGGRKPSLPGIKLDDEVGFHDNGVRYLRRQRHADHLGALAVLHFVEFRNVTLGEILGFQHQRHLARGILDLDEIADLDQERWDVDPAAVHLDVAVVDELARGEDRRHELGAIDHRIEPALEQADQVVAGVALHADRLGVILAELLLGDVAVIALELLLGLQLGAEVGKLALAALAVLAGAVLAAVHRALRTAPDILAHPAVDLVLGFCALRHRVSSDMAPIQDTDRPARPRKEAAAV